MGHIVGPLKMIRTTMSNQCEQHFCEEAPARLTEHGKTQARVDLGCGAENSTTCSRDEAGFASDCMLRSLWYSLDEEAKSTTIKKRNRIYFATLRGNRTVIKCGTKPRLRWLTQPTVRRGIGRFSQKQLFSLGSQQRRKPQPSTSTSSNYRTYLIQFVPASSIPQKSYTYEAYGAASTQRSARVSRTN